MNENVTNIFLTGSPSSGKTTVIKKVIAMLKRPIKGFYTEEELKGERRCGFLMKTIDGRRGYLAHRSIQSEYGIRRYGVSIENIESIAVPSIVPEKGTVVICDEIGKMECFSEAFRAAALAALDAPNLVIGTITLGGDEFIRAIKERRDIEIIEVTRENRDSLPDLIVERAGLIM
ncbi:MAG: hypothetical protein JW881_04130 [Spirochaetales bacterium]|nr:hypothetical protein [Spirochaetales bacterium]